MNHSNYTRQIVFTGRKIRAGRDIITTDDGTEVSRDVVLHPGAVAILPWVDDNHLCLIRNKREIVGETLWEIPAGTLNPDESPDHAAPRELAEETGFTAACWTKIAEFFPSPGILSERTHLYVAQQLTPGPMHLEKDEELEPRVVAWEEALKSAFDGTIRDAKTLVALLLWWGKMGD